MATPAVVQEKHVAPRSYVVATPKGQIRRNRAQLEREPPPASDADAQSETATSSKPELPQPIRQSTRNVKKPDRLIENV